MLAAPGSPLDYAQPLPESDTPLGVAPPPDHLGPSALAVGARAAARQALPTAGGVAAFPAGAAAGSLAVAPLAGAATATGFGAPVGAGIEGLGAIGGGLATSLGAGYLVDRAQDEIIGLLPTGWARALGIDAGTRAEDQAAHPRAAFLGGLVPQALFARPGWAGWKAAAGGAAVNAGVETGMELHDTGHVDPVNIGVQAFVGGFFGGGNTRAGDLVQAPAERIAAAIPTGSGVTAAAASARDTIAAGVRGAADAVAETREAALARLFPALPEGVRRRWTAAGTLDDHVAIAQLRDRVGADSMTPDEEAAVHVLEGEASARESNPLPGLPGSDATHGRKLAATTSALLADQVPSTSTLAIAAAGAPLDVGFHAPNASWHAAIEHVESRGNPDAVSSKGARGRMQVMDATNRDPGYGVRPAADDSEGERTRVGRDYADALERHYGNKLLATAAYNAGPGNVDHWLRTYGDPRNGGIDAARWVSRLPAAETRRYVREVFGELGHDMPDAGEAAAPATRSFERAEGLPAYTLDQYTPDEIGVDAATMQFKEGGDEQGVTDRLAGVTQWNPLLADRLVVWQRADGERFIVDGHQRLGLAKRIQAADPDQDIRLDAITLRERDGITAGEARAWGAVRNIAEGTGTAIDAAKVLRDRPELASELPPRSPLVRDARALASLSDDAFGAVANGVIEPEHAAAIGRLLPNSPELHGAMVDLLGKLEPQTRAQAESIVRQAHAAGFTKEEQQELFGKREVTSSLFLAKAKVLERALARIRRLRSAHNTAVREASTLEASGSAIAREASEREAAENAQALELVERLAYRAGPVADALDAAAREYASGGQLGEAAKRLADAVRQIDLPALAADAGERPGEALDGDPVEAGDVPEPEGPPDELSAAEGGADDGPSLFDDPAGPSAERQARSLEHDLQMAAAEPADANRASVVGRDEIVAGQRGRSLEDLHALAERNQEELNRVGPEIAREAGAEFKSAGAKDIGRARQKLENEGYADAGELKDLARGAFKVDTPEQGQAIVDRFAARYGVHDKGWQQLPASGYLDRKLTVRMADGGVAEVQIVPGAVWDYKFGEGHKLYANSRDPATSAAERDRLDARQREAYAALLSRTEFASASSAAKSTEGNSRSAAARESGMPSDDALLTSPGASFQRPADQAQATRLDDVSTRPTARSSTSNSSSDVMVETSEPNIASNRLIGNEGGAFRVAIEGDDRPLAQLLRDIDQEQGAADALRGCLPPKGATT